MTPLQPMATAALEADNQLDPQQIASLRSLRRGALLPQLLRTYRDQAAEQIAAIRKATECGDHAAIRFAAHMLKSASFSVGANHIGQLCAQLEAKAVTQNQQDAAALCLALQERYAQLLPEIVEYTTP